MKKTLLTLAVLGTFFAGATAAELTTPVWTNTAAGAFPEGESLWNAPVAVDAEGNLIASGSFSEDFTLADSELEAIGESAFLAKYNAEGEAQWAVAFTGAATITAIDTDAEGNIYVAGSLADEVTFGTTSGNPVVKEGAKDEYDSPYEKENAAFIAKYTADGEVVTVETIIASTNPEIYELEDWDLGPFYFNFDGNFFKIKQIKVVEDTIYIGATYNGDASFAGATFSAPFVVLDGFMLIEDECSSVFTIDTDLDSAQVIATAKFNGENGAEVENTSEVWSVRFDVEENQMFIGFVGNDALTMICGDQEYPSVSVNGASFILAYFTNGACEGYQNIETDMSFNYTDNSLALVKIVGENVVLAGQKYFEVPNPEDEYEPLETYNYIFVANRGADKQISLKEEEVTEGDINYTGVASAVVIDGDVYLNAFGYYNKEDDALVYGEFAESVKSLVFSNGAFADSSVNATWMAVNGDYVAVSNILEAGPAFSLYSLSNEEDPDAGVSSIGSDLNAPVEYFNLQGVKVVNPDKGVYIMKQGKTVKKVVR